MELFPPIVSAIASISYLGYGTKKYLEFKKFQNVGYIGDFHLLSGKITSSAGLFSFINEYNSNLLAKRQLPVHNNAPLNCYQSVANTLLSRLTVEVGKEKIGTNYIPMKVGKVTVMMPQQYKYTDWKTTHSKMYWANDILFGDKMKLLFPEKQVNVYFTNNVSIKEQTFEEMYTLQQLFRTNNINFHQGNKVRVFEEMIHNGEEISVFGKYQMNKFFEVHHIGSKDKLLAAVRQQVCKVNYGLLSMAAVIAITSFGCLAVQYDELNHNKEKKDTYY